MDALTRLFTRAFEAVTHVDGKPRDEASYPLPGIPGIMRKLAEEGEVLTTLAAKDHIQQFASVANMLEKREVPEGVDIWELTLDRQEVSKWEAMQRLAQAMLDESQAREEEIRDALQDQQQVSAGLADLIV